WSPEVARPCVVLHRHGASRAITWQLEMAGSTSGAALDLVWGTLDATIALGQDMPSLPCGRSQRPTRPSCAQHPRIPWNQPSAEQRQVLSVRLQQLVHHRAGLVEIQ